MKTAIAGTLAALAFAFVAVPAFAAEFYVIQDTASKKCSVADSAPTITTMALVGDKAGYKTHAEAEAAMDKDAVCKSK